MMLWGIVWILSDVSLVQLHFAGATWFAKVAVLALISLGAVAWQVGVQRRAWLTSVVPVFGLVAVACWQTAGLPAVDAPAPRAGQWVGVWEGLPGRSSALFHPYRQPDRTTPVVDSTADCRGEPLPYRIWVRGIKPAYHQSNTVLPGLCVSLRLEADDQASTLPAALETWRQRNRIIASMRIVKNSPIEVLAADTDRVDALRLSIRHDFENAAALEGNQRWSYLKKLPVLLGLVTGDRALMKPSHWKVFSDTGTSHLMSISGSHVSMFALFVFTVVRRLLSRSTWLTTRVPAQHVALIAGWLGACGYALLAGFNVPTQRTLVMIGVAVLLRIRGRSLLDWRAWWIALVAVTVYDPLAIFDRGAWLSFFAVALILWVLQGRLRSPGVIHGWLLVQMGIFFGLAPLLLYAFGGFPWISPVANALAIPVTGFLVVPGAMLVGVVLAMVPALAPYVLPPVICVTDAFLWFLQAMADMGGAGYRVPLLSDPLQGTFVTLFALAGVLWCLAPRGIPGKSVALVLVLPVMLGPGFYARQSAGIQWLSSGQRQGFLYEDAQSLWWVFEAGQSSRARQALWTQWARDAGVGYTWDLQKERYADWVKSGFLVHRYDKVFPLPGQVHLKPPVLVLPCLQTQAIALASNPASDEKVTLKALPAGEQACWLRVMAPSGPLLMAGNLSRDVQLAQAGESSIENPAESGGTLLVTPRSNTRLFGATLNRFQPSEVVEWPAASSLFPDAEPKLQGRGIRHSSFRDFVLRTRPERKLSSGENSAAD